MDHLLLHLLTNDHGEWNIIIGLANDFMMYGRAWLAVRLSALTPNTAESK
jgi:hypothetical protein